ncbi:hypothetical protein [Shinella sp. NM-101]|uniref:hypothetical protein n=1 Tax=Shinella sp. NM-101 TaxID=2744455 RepID=UPI001F48AD21|nr:hypothetical protein [Shinella sp. NM-101]
MQDPNLVNRPVEDPNARRPEDRGPTVVNASSGGSGAGGWAVAVILAVLVAVGIYYFVGGGSPDRVEPNANTPAVGTPDTPAAPAPAPATAPAPAPAPAGSTPTDGQTGGTTGGTQSPESQPAEGGGATTTTP